MNRRKMFNLFGAAAMAAVIGRRRNLRSLLCAGPEEDGDGG
jgi:hypothetical protein